MTSHWQVLVVVKGRTTVHGMYAEEWQAQGAAAGLRGDHPEWHVAVHYCD